MLPRLLSAGFGAQSIYAARETYPEIRDAIKRGDVSETERLLTHAVLDLGMATLAARHAAMGKGAVSGKAEAPVEAPTPIETHPIKPISPVGELFMNKLPVCVLLIIPLPRIIDRPGYCEDRRSRTGGARSGSASYKAGR